MVDTCRSHGTWFDAGELASVREHLTKKREAASPAKEEASGSNYQITAENLKEFQPTDPRDELWPGVNNGVVTEAIFTLIDWYRDAKRHEPQ